MAIASGTIGTCPWSISDSGELTIGAGTIKDIMVIMATSWPWYKYSEQIKTVSITGDVNFGTFAFDSPPITSDMFSNCTALTAISGLNRLNVSNVTSMSRMFSGCSSLRTLNDISSLNVSNVTDMDLCFRGCSSLTSLDLSGWNTEKVEHFNGMFEYCSSLTVVIIGPSFSMLAAEEDNANTKIVDWVFGSSAKNTTNDIVLTSDKDFYKLTTEERQGVWDRNVKSTYSVTAKRTNGDRVDEDGEDVTLFVKWVTDAETTERTLSVYYKPASSSTYPSTPTATKTLTGDSGDDTITITNLGDSAFDFKVVFYDGTNYFTAYPSVSANIRLVTIDKNGNVEVLGTINAASVAVSGLISSAKLAVTKNASDTGTNAVTVNNGTNDALTVGWDGHTDFYSANLTNGDSPSAQTDGIGVIRLVDSTGAVLGKIAPRVETNGKVGLRLASANANGAENVLNLGIAQDGTKSVSVTDANAWLSALGLKVSTVTNISQIITAASNITINSASYAQWGKLAVLYMRATTNTARSGNFNVGTLVAGKRPAIEAGGETGSGSHTCWATAGGIVAYNGGNVAAKATIYCKITYLLA